MTLSERNLFFKVGMVFCAVITLFTLAVSFLIIPSYSAIEENARRPVSFFQYITGFFFAADYLAVHASIALAVLFSLIAMILIHAFFERTSAQEILFISFFVFSLSFEVIRFMVPLNLLAGFPMFYLITMMRILLFARYIAIFSLFAASIYAAGLEIQRMRNIILVIIVPALIITMGVTIDAQTWDTGFILASGYTAMLKTIELIVFIAVIVNFLVAVKVRNSNEYFFVGIGTAIAMTGRYLLISTDNWIGPVAGIVLLSFGIWFVSSKLHKLHLWL